jgi:hypothetical protein
MEFKGTPHVNAAKVARFVKRIEDWQKQNSRGEKCKFSE